MPMAIGIRAPANPKIASPPRAAGPSRRCRGCGDRDAGERHEQATQEPFELLALDRAGHRYRDANDHHDRSDQKTAPLWHSRGRDPRGPQVRADAERVRIVGKTCNGPG